MTDSTHNTQQLQDFFFKLVEARPHIAERIQNNLLTNNELGWASKEDKASMHKATRQATTEVLLNPIKKPIQPRYAEACEAAKLPNHRQARCKGAVECFYDMFSRFLSHALRFQKGALSERLQEWECMSDGMEMLIYQLVHAISQGYLGEEIPANHHVSPTRKLYSRYLELQSSEPATPAVEILRRMLREADV